MTDHYLVAYFQQGDSYTACLIDPKGDVRQGSSGLDLYHLGRRIVEFKHNVPEDIPVGIIDMVPEGETGTRVSRNEVKTLTEIIAKQL